MRAASPLSLALVMLGLTVTSRADAQSTSGPDQVVVDAVGHCCSPGQSWDPDARTCVGIPAPAACGPDQLAVDAAGHCCSPVDVYLSAGVGAISLRPVPMIFPTQTYDYSVSVDLAYGAGTRLFLTPFLALSLELRGAIYEEPTESVMAGPLESPETSRRFTLNLQTSMGVSVWFPMM
ncbi:MAG: hypothetical protein JST54_33900 [Deltaproteobacteria bacterium]|nr:hypothetical protein [Deltaproteobacteria bacterium]